MLLINVSSTLATSGTVGDFQRRCGDLNKTANNGDEHTETKLFQRLSEMLMIVEENEELENDAAERVEGGTSNTPNDASRASAATDAFAMIVHNQGTSDVAMVSEHISSFEGTEICVQPVKEESVSIFPSCIFLFWADDPQDTHN